MDSTESLIWQYREITDMLEQNWNCKFLTCLELTEWLIISLGVCKLITFFKVPDASYFCGLDLIERSVLTAHISSALPNNTLRNHFSKKKKFKLLFLWTTTTAEWFVFLSSFSRDKWWEREIEAARKRDTAFGRNFLPCVKTIGRWY